MQCPFCGKDNDRVVDSRSSEGGRAVRRRRHCQACGKRYTTYERPEDVLRLTVRKKDGTREPYSRDKVIEGLRRACYKRPIEAERLRQIVDAIEEVLLQDFDRDVPSQAIGDAVSRLLRKTDKIAYIRFASVYRSFDDVGELINEARDIEDSPVVHPDQRGLFEDSEGTDDTDDVGEGPDKTSESS